MPRTARPPPRLGVEWRGRGAAAAKGTAVPMPKSWCGNDEAWSPTASDLQDFLARNKSDAEAFIAPPAARCSIQNKAPSDADSTAKDEAEIIALLHAVSPTFACARASKSLDLDCMTATSSLTPLEQVTLSASRESQSLPPSRCANTQLEDEQPILPLGSQHHPQRIDSEEEVPLHLVPSTSADEAKHARHAWAGFLEEVGSGQSGTNGYIEPAAPETLNDNTDQTSRPCESANEVINRYCCQRDYSLRSALSHTTGTAQGEIQDATEAADQCGVQELVHSRTNKEPDTSKPDEVDCMESDKASSAAQGQLHIDEDVKQKGQSSIQRYRVQRQRAARCMPAEGHGHIVESYEVHENVAAVSAEAGMEACRDGPTDLANSLASVGGSVAESTEHNGTILAQVSDPMLSDGVSTKGQRVTPSEASVSVPCSMTNTARAPPAPRETPSEVAARFARARSIASMADAALSQSTNPSKAALFVNMDALAPLLSEDLVSTAQIACGAEARVKLSGKSRVHISVNAVDECALDRSLIAILVLMSHRSEMIDMELRWLLRAPTREPRAVLTRWQEAVDASQRTHPIKTLQAELHADQSCMRLTMTSDGWEDWNENSAKLAPGASAAFVLSWLLCYVRYARWPRTLYIPLELEQAHALGLDHSARLRSLSTQSESLIILLRKGPALLVCGPRTCVGKAKTLFRAWTQAEAWAE